MSNTITAFFKGRAGVAESVYQYDYGKILIIDGLSLPATFEVHFTSISEDDSITVIGQNNRVAIPDDCINKPGTVTAYIYLHTGENDGETEYVIKFAVIRRARPDYDEDDKSDWESAASQALAMLQNSKKVNTPLDEYNQVDNGIAGQVLRTKGDGSTEWVFEGLPTDEQTAEAVSAWLDEHPEATTTVQDGSLTEAKFSDTLKLKTIKDYVTPEMFGAKGDGETDDTEAVQSAVSSGKPVCLFNQYYISDTIVITNNCPAFRNFGSVTYSGNGYAFLIDACRDKEYDFGTIISSSGGCIKLDSTNGYIQYLNIYFTYLSASSSCFYLNCPTSWINEIRFFGGMLFAGDYGYYLNNPAGTKGHLMFYNIGFEGVTTGIFVNGKWNRLSAYGCRMEESTTYLLNADNVPAGSDIGLQWYGDLNQKYIPLTCAYPVYVQGILISRFGTPTCENGVILKGEIYNAFAPVYAYVSPYDGNDSISIEGMYTADELGNYFKIPNVPGDETRSVYLPKLFYNRINNRVIYLEVYLSSGAVINIYSSEENLITSITGGGKHILKIWYVQALGYVVEEAPVIAVTDVE